MDNNNEIQIKSNDSFGADELEKLIRLSVYESVSRISEEIKESVNECITSNLVSIKNQFEGQFQKDKIYWYYYTKKLLEAAQIDDIITPNIIKESILNGRKLKNYQGFSPSEFEKIRDERQWGQITNEETMEKLIIETVFAFRNSII